jgi:predicted PurR-regulated permease PerM
MAVAQASSRHGGTEWTPVKSAIAVVLTIGALYYARELLIPFALALILSFLLTPPVTWLEKIGLRRSISVLLVLLFSFALLV